MVKVEIGGYSYQEGTKKFDILDRETLSEILDEINTVEVYRATFQKAENYKHHGGTAYTYIDARDGSLWSSWLGQNTMNHPWDSFYEIWLCKLTTGAGAVDLDTEEHLLDLSDLEEMKRWRDFDGSLKEFLGEEYDERMENAIDWLATEYELDWEDINKQLEELYSHQIEAETRPG